ncbi:phBC6A51 family helix-turn-helix protein [Bacillus weihaiensis]|uniref:phBC6A51 family helix-turn-helix protein n=1 Tax=Bacillus weihaiensis TaxID=1547283 RepID=UPI002354D346|nr:phBC6A51 family helix-turn-helix protein [Bacillus weihaiensis]
MSEEKLNKQQLAAAQLLALGTIDKQDIAKQVGISKTTLYNWINKNGEFVAEVDTIKRDFKNFGNQLMEARLVDAVNGYWNLIQKTDNAQTAAKGFEYFIDRSLGKVTSNLKLTTEVENIKPIDKDTLDAEFEQFKQEMLESNEDNEEV